VGTSALVVKFALIGDVVEVLEVWSIAEISDTRKSMYVMRMKWIGWFEAMISLMLVRVLRSP
jgi:hypothetical protein